MEPIEQVTDIYQNPYKELFPLLRCNSELAFCDSAATAQRPACVIEAQKNFYETLNSNPLRGLYRLSIEATQAIDDARAKIAAFIGVYDKDEIVFTRNASESLNVLARCAGENMLQPGDEVCISIMEHHSNLIPWQQVCKRTGAKLVYLRPDDQGIITQEEIEAKICPATKIVSCTHVSNVLGVCNPVRALADRAHEVGALMFVDGAQSTPHMRVDVNELGCDAFAFSAHKMFGPMGIGVLWARRELLEAWEPNYTGGEMIDSVTEDSAVWAPIPEKFEAGTQDAAGIAATGAAVDFMQAIGFEAIEARDAALVTLCMDKMKELGFIELIGPDDPAAHHGVVSFNVKGVHPHDVSSILDSLDVAIRAGHHCAQPLLTSMGIDSCCRASFAFYNDASDVEKLINGLSSVWRIFHGA